MFCCSRGELKNDRPKTVSIFIGFFFLVNFVLGAGFLGIPFTFFHGGVLAGACTLVVIAVVAWQTALYEVETMSRAQAVSDLKDGLYDTSNTSTKPDFKVKDSRKFEISELCDIFVGRWFKIVYLVVLNLHAFLTLITYSTVASSAWSVNIPFNFGTLHECDDRDFLHQYFPLDAGCAGSYRLCLALFAIIVIPLSLLELKEQAIIQFLLGVLRFIMLGSIIIYCLFHLLSGDHISYEDAPNIDDLNITILDVNHSMTPVSEIVLHFDIKGWILGIPVIFYAIMLHQGIPSLVHPIREKKWLKWCFIVLFITIGSFYMIISALGAVWFRDIINETFTLNWVPFTASDNSSVLRVFSYFIILFPSIDVCSVFPLVVHATTNNIYVVVFCKDTSQEKGLKPKVIQLILKFIVALLPLVAALFITNLVYIVKYAGLVGFFIGLFCPIIIQLRSQWVCSQLFSFISSQNGKSVELKKFDEIPVKKDKAVNGFGTKQEVVEDDDVDDVENDPLIDDSKSLATEPFTMKRLTSFLFTAKDSALYHTPYSTLLSYPLSVISLTVLSSILIMLTILSLFFHPTKISS